MIRFAAGACLQALRLSKRRRPRLPTLPLRVREMRSRRARSPSSTLIEFKLGGFLGVALGSPCPALRDPSLRRSVVGVAFHFYCTFNACVCLHKRTYSYARIRHTGRFVFQTPVTMHRVFVCVLLLRPFPLCCYKLFTRFAHPPVGRLLVWLFGVA